MKAQRYLKKGGLIALISVLSMVTPLSTDMYMSALPTMAEYFGSPVIIMNITMAVFFLFMAIGMLVLGPLSDKNGRRGTLMVSLFFYTAASAAAALAGNVYILIAARILQGFGGGGMISISTAIIKDSFPIDKRAAALAVVQSLSVIGPIAAPVAGAIVLQRSSWRAIFWILAAIGGVCLAASIFLEETLPEKEKHQGRTLDTLRRTAAVARNRNFTAFLLPTALHSAPFMAYLAVASYIYIDYFGLKEITFSIFFAVNSVFLAFGPMVYIKLNKVLSDKSTMNILITLSMLTAAGLLLFGEKTPAVFLCCFLPFSFANSYIRPFSTNILLNQVDGDTGSASALINFAHCLFGSIGMIIGSLPWKSYVTGLALTTVIFDIGIILLWTAVLKSSRVSLFK